MGQRERDSVVPPLIDVTDVAVVGDHRLRLTFKDGTVGDVAFDEREWRGVFEPLADPNVFAQVCVEMGTIAWPNGLDMAPEPLYEEASRHAAARPNPRHQTDSP
jgi:hypothetical protein